jgi:two-component system alkaline phosphatase synthesis response regulator PhoP
MNPESFSGCRILLVEDEESLALGLEYNLKEEGYLVNWARDGKQALKLFKSENFDMIILDIMLPYHNGFEIAKIVRSKHPQMPILMLTARAGVEDRVKGLELGADDYLTKPFHLDELLLRIKGMLRRKEWYKSLTSQQSLYSFGGFEINFENLRCKKGKDKFQLTAYEAMVLKYLIDNKGNVVTRKELLENVWHMNPEIETRTVDNFIARLRKYFEIDPSKPVYITSIRSAGYMFQD